MSMVLALGHRSAPGHPSTATCFLLGGQHRGWFGLGRNGGRRSRPLGEWDLGRLHPRWCWELWGEAGAGLGLRSALTRVGQEALPARDRPWPRRPVPDTSLPFPSSRIHPGGAPCPCPPCPYCGCSCQGAKGLIGCWGRIHVTASPSPAAAPHWRRCGRRFLCMWQTRQLQSSPEQQPCSTGCTGCHPSTIHSSIPAPLNHGVTPGQAHWHGDIQDSRPRARLFSWQVPLSPWLATPSPCWVTMTLWRPSSLDGAQSLLLPPAQPLPQRPCRHQKQCWNDPPKDTAKAPRAAGMRTPPWKAPVLLCSRGTGVMVPSILPAPASSPGAQCSTALEQCDPAQALPLGQSPCVGPSELRLLRPTCQDGVASEAEPSRAVPGCPGPTPCT